MKYLILTLTAIVLICCACKAQKKSGRVLPVAEYAASLSNDSNAVLIDVRTPEEYAAGHIEGAQLLNVLEKETFEAGVKTLAKDKAYYIYCRSGRRSQTAAAIMERNGLNVTDLQGGFNAWKAAGMEEER